jgi:hypothetical protein
MTPVAPAVPRVRKGLPEGSALQLTAQEERDVIIEYKCVPRATRHTPAVLASACAGAALRR